MSKNFHSRDFFPAAAARGEDKGLKILRNDVAAPLSFAARRSVSQERVAE
jgi:hypothetical protein